MQTFIKNGILSVTLSAILVSSPLFAAHPFDAKIKSVFGEGNVMSNTTNSSEWKDPATGVSYYSGGGMTFKFKNSGSFTRWADARAPGFKTGCSGFSFDAGFVSFIDLDKMIEQLQTAGTSMVGGFMSSILYSTPILGEIIAKVKEISDKITRMLQNACNIGKKMGSMTSDFMEEKLGLEDPSHYIDQVTDTVGVDAVLDEIDSNLGDLENNLKCFGEDNVTSCIENLNTKDSNKAGANSVKEILENANISGSGATDITGSNQTKDSKKTSSFVDKMKLSDYLDMGEKKSDKEFFGASSNLAGYGANIMKLYFLTQEHKTGTHEVCNHLKSLDELTESGTTLTTEQKEKLKALLKKTMVKGDDKSEESVKQKDLAIYWKDDSGRIAFDKDRDLGEFILTGQASALSTIYVNDAILYVAQFSDSAATNVGNETVKKHTVLCHTTSEFGITWSGFPAIDAVEVEINKIASDLSPSGTVIVVSEAAQLAKTLGHKAELDRVNESVIALTITSRNIALLNNFILTERLLEAFKELDSLINTSFTADDVTLNHIDDYLGRLTRINEALKEKLENMAGAQSFMGSIMRDADRIEKAYAVYALKKNRR